MKRIIAIFKRMPILLALVIILIFFTPTNLAKPLETVRNAVITTIGVDYSDNEFEVTLLSFIPTPAKDFIETYSISSIKAKTLSEAIVNAGLQLGKDVSLFHTEVAILGKGVLDEDVSKLLDYFSREESLSNSCILLGTNKTAKEMLKFMQKEDINPSDKLREIMLYSSEHVNCKTSSIESFYSGFYSPVKCSFMPYIELFEGDSEEGIMLNNSSTSGAEATPSDEPKKELKNDGKVVVFKDGRKVNILNEELVDGMNWINCDKTSQNIVIENFTDKNLTDARVVYFMNKKNVIKNTSFENGVPVFTVSLKLHVNRIEVYGDRQDLKTNIQLSDIDEKVEERIEERVKSQFSDALAVLRQDKTDLLGVYREFYQKNRGEFKEFLKNLEDEEDFLNYVVFQLNIKVVAD